MLKTGIVIVIAVILFALGEKKGITKLFFSPLYGLSASIPKTNSIIIEDYDSSALIKKHLDAIKIERDMPVYLVKNSVERLLAYQALKKVDINSAIGKSVLIKPNLGGFVRMRDGEDNGVDDRVTSPEFVRGIIDRLKELGIKDIAIGESWGVTDPSLVKKLFRISGYEKLAVETGVKLIDLNYYNNGKTETSPIKIKIPDAAEFKDDIYLPSIYVKYMADGFVINVPKMKTHRFAVTSLSCKNLMGVLLLKGHSPYFHANKSGMHPEINSWFAKKELASDDKKKMYVDSFRVFSRRLADLYLAAKADVTIVDGYRAVEGDGFDSITRRPEHVAFAGRSQIQVDRAATEYMGFGDSAYLKTKFGFSTSLYLDEMMARYYPELAGIKKAPNLVNDSGVTRMGAEFILKPMIGD